MAHLWTLFGKCPKTKKTRIRITGAPATEADARAHAAAHFPTFVVASIHPGHIEKPEDAAPADATATA